MIKELGNTPEINFLRGISALYSNNTEDAKKMFLEGCKLDPDNEKCKTALKNVKKLESLKEKGFFFSLLMFFLFLF